MSSFAIDDVFYDEIFSSNGKRCGKRNTLPCEECASRRVRCVWIRVPNFHESPLCQACDKRGSYECQPRAQTCRKSRMTRKRNMRALVAHGDVSIPSQFIPPSNIHDPIQHQAIGHVPLDETQADIPRRSQQSPLFGGFAQYPATTAVHLGAVSDPSVQRYTAATLTAPPALTQGTQAVLFGNFDRPPVADNFMYASSVSSQSPTTPSQSCMPSMSNGGVLWSHIGPNHQLGSELQFNPLPLTLGGWVPVPCNFVLEDNASEALNLQQAFNQQVPFAGGSVDHNNEFEVQYS